MNLVRFSVSADPELLDALADCLLSAGAGALEEGPSCLRAYAESPELVQALEQAVVEFRARAREALPDLTVGEPEILSVEVDWQRAWLDQLEPEQVTHTFVARPMHRPDAPPGERTIWLEASPAFGEGGHPSTRLAARIIERLAKERPGIRLLDVGTGTGLLALVALSSGFESALGIDVDSNAVDAATRNAAHNGVGERFQISAAPLATIPGKFDVVAANIVFPTLIELASTLVSKVAEGGRLVLSGFLLEDVAGLAAHFGDLGAVEVSRKAEGDWCSLELALAEVAP